MAPSVESMYQNFYEDGVNRLRAPVAKATSFIVVVPPVSWLLIAAVIPNQRAERQQRRLHAGAAGHQEQLSADFW